MKPTSDLVPMSSGAAPDSLARQWVMVMSLGLLLLCAGAVGTAALLPVAERTPSGATLIGVPVGDLNRVGLRAAIEGPVAARVAGTVRLQILDNTVDIEPPEVGITLDQAATERAVLARAPENLLARLRDRWFGAGVTSEAVIVVDEPAARQALGERLAEVQREVSDAQITVPIPQPVLLAKGDAEFAATEVAVEVVPARTGQLIDVPAVVTALAEAVRAQRATLPVEVQVTEPAMATEQAAAVDQLIGSFTTEYACCEPRVTNIQRIAELVDEQVIAPGGTFSLNRAAGPRTWENGFVAGPAIADGELVDQYGGGVSQFSTTLFNAAWFAGLPVPEHQPHSRYIDRYPPGREATLDYDTIDLVIGNDTAAPIVIRTSTTATSVTVGLYGHTGDRAVASTTGPRQPGGDEPGGFRVEVERVVRQGAAEVGRDTLTWTYAAVE